MKLCGWSCVLKKTSIYIGPLVDDEGLALSYTVTGLPEGIDVVYVEVAADGREPGAYLQGYIAYSNVASNAPPVDFRVRITFTREGDDNSLQTNTLTWTISDTNRIEPLGPLYNREGERIEIQVLASDVLGNTLTYQLSGQPGTLTMDTATGLISGYISYRNVSASEGTKTFRVTVSVTGGGATDYRTFDWTIEDVDWFSQSLVAENREGEWVTLELPATDAEGNQVTYISAEGMPIGITFDAAAGRLSGGISYANADGETPLRDYPVAVTYEVAGSTETRSFVCRIHNVNGIAAVTDQFNAEGEQVELYLGPLYDLLGNRLSYDTVERPDGLSIEYRSSSESRDIEGAYLVGRIAYRNVSSGALTRNITVTAILTDNGQPTGQDIRQFEWVVHDRNRIVPIAPRTDIEGSWIDQWVDVNVPMNETYAVYVSNLPPGLFF